MDYTALIKAILASILPLSGLMPTALGLFTIADHGYSLYALMLIIVGISSIIVGMYVLLSCVPKSTSKGVNNG